MCPADHSSGSRTSTMTAPLPTCSRTAAGSTSSIMLLIWRRTSAPDGLIRKNSSNAVGIQYFREYSERGSMSGPLFPVLADTGDGEAIRIADRSFSYSELAGAAAALATRLTGPARVAVWAEPTLELAVATVAALAAGVAVVPINPGLGSRELGHIVTDSAPDRLLAWTGVDPPPQLRALPRTDIGRRATSHDPLPDHLADDDVAFVMYTSG